MPESYDNLKTDRDRLRKELGTLRDQIAATLKVKPKKTKKKRTGRIPQFVPLVPVLCQWPEDWVAAMDELVKRDGHESRASFVRNAISVKIRKDYKEISLSSPPSWGQHKSGE